MDEYLFDERGHALSFSTTGERVLAMNIPADLEGGDGEQRVYVSGVSYSCGICATVPVYQIKDGTVFPERECPYPQGIISRNKVSFPSGKVVVNDSLRPVFNADFDTIASYNTALGQAQAIELYASQNCAYGPVGNSCPSIYQLGEDIFEIGNPECPDYDYDDPEATEPEPLPYPGAIKELAGICTDLWAYSIADLEHFLAVGGETAKKMLPNLQVLTIPAGTYEFTHFTGARDFSYDAPGATRFARFQRI